MHHIGNSISRERGSLMGIAILFIMLYHSGFVIETDAFKWGDVGVEMFAVLSAIGVCFSLTHQTSVSHFYKRRLLRILPAYFVVAAPYALYRHFAYGASWGHVASVITGLSTFRGDITFWFVSYILVCYLLTPLFLSVKKTLDRPFALTGIVIVVSYVLFLLLNRRISNCYLWCLRFPAFALGCDLYDYVMVGKNNDYEKNTDIKSLVVSVIGVILSISLLYLISRYVVNVSFRLLGYLIIVVPLILSLSEIFSTSRCLSSVFSFLGSITLELYLLHEHIVLPLIMRINLNIWIIVVIAIVCAVILSFLVSAIVSRMKMAFSHRVKSV